MKKVSNPIVTNQIASKADAPVFDNLTSKGAKAQIRDYFGSYADMLETYWNGLKKQDAAIKAINAVIAGFAGSEGLKPYEYVIKYFSKYIDANNVPCTRKVNKDTKAVYYTRKIESGVYARGILKAACINCVESARKGNRFSQTIVEPVK